MLHLFTIEKTQIAPGSKAMKIPGNLTLEQQFKLKVYQDQVNSMSKQEAQECLLEVLRQMMVKDNLVKQLLKNA